MSSGKQRQHEGDRGFGQLSATESGVLPKGLSAQLDRPPPWDIVHAYLATGQHRAWVEGYASRAPSFAEVLAALRNDALERQEDDAKVTPIRRK
jgi:hypothetical protein